MFIGSTDRLPADRDRFFGSVSSIRVRAEQVEKLLEEEIPTGLDHPVQVATELSAELGVAAGSTTRRSFEPMFSP